MAQRESFEAQQATAKRHLPEAPAKKTEPKKRSSAAPVYFGGAGQSTLNFLKKS